MTETATNLLENKFSAFRKQFQDSIMGADTFRDDLTFMVDSKAIHPIIAYLKNDPEYQFNMMMDLFGIDYLKYSVDQPERYAVVYILYSIKFGIHLRIKAYVNEKNPELASIHDVYKAANWFEREAWDMYGIVFKGHPNLIRILTHNEFVGHPLRKDYPADGYQQLKSVAMASEI